VLYQIEVISWLVPAGCLECAVIEKAEYCINGKNTPFPAWLCRRNGSETLLPILAYS
jgi:hypothetical protein